MSVSARDGANTTYVVMLAWPVESDGEEGVSVGWFDTVEVTVPARTKRRTVLERAVRQAGVVPAVGVPVEARILDEESACVWRVSSEQQLRIEGVE